DRRRRRGEAGDREHRGPPGALAALSRAPAACAHRAAVLPRRRLDPAARDQTLRLRAALSAAGLVSDRSTHGDARRPLGLPPAGARVWRRSPPDGLAEDPAAGRAGPAIALTLRPPADAAAPLRGPGAGRRGAGVPERRQPAADQLEGERQLWPASSA